MKEDADLYSLPSTAGKKKGEGQMTAAPVLL